MKKERPFARINTLEKLARDFRTKSITDSEIEKNDITDIVLNEIPYILDGEIFNMCIQGKTKSSKSTLMIWFINYILQEYYGRTIQMENIYAEQFEFTRKVTDENLHDTIVGIDEFGEMETSGANATIEEKMLEQFSSIQAQRNIHRIWCSPRTAADKNSNILLKIMSKDVNTLTTHALVYYKVEAPNEWYVQLVGRISICIEDIMFTPEGWFQFYETYKRDYERGMEKGEFWKKVRDKYKLQEFEPVGKHKPYGEYMHPIYYRYRKRKFMKFKLLNKEGITQMRQMVFAEITLYAYEKLRNLCGIVPITKDNIETKINQKLREIKYPLTIYAMEVVKSSVNNLLSQEKTIQQLRIKLIKEKSPQNKIKINNAIKEIQMGLQRDLEEITHLIEINKEYNGI